MQEGRILQRGAEAVIRLREGSIVKERIRKGYRIPELDETIRRQRTKLEVSLLERARRAGVRVPDASMTDKYIITMGNIDGERLKDALNGMKRPEQTGVAGKIGEVVAALHSSDIVHGDLTTSNMILKGNELYVIDFGLGRVSNRAEDKATDLFLLWEALQSAHFEIADMMWKNIINTYALKYSNAPEVIKRLGSIERRRRYK